MRFHPVLYAIACFQAASASRSMKERRRTKIDNTQNLFQPGALVIIFFARTARFLHPTNSRQAAVFGRTCVRAGFIHSCRSCSGLIVLARGLSRQGEVGYGRQAHTDRFHNGVLVCTPCTVHPRTYSLGLVFHLLHTLLTGTSFSS